MFKSIEEYWEDINSKTKGKIIFLGILLSLFLLINISHPVYSGKFFDWIKGAIGTALIDSDGTNITDEINVSFIQGVSSTAQVVYEQIVDVAVKPFGPTADTWNQRVGSKFLKNIRDYGVYIGMFTATALFFFGIFVYFFSGKVTDTKDTPISLAGKYIVTLGLLYLVSTASFQDTFLSFINEIYDSYSEFHMSEIKAGLEFKNFITDYKGGGGEGLVILGIALIMPEVIPFFTFFVLILGVILLFIFVKNLVKLYCELITRYILSFVLLNIAGAFMGTIVSNNTSNIFKSYFQTVLSSFFLLIFDMFWIKLCLEAVSKCFGSGTGQNIINFIFVIELLKLGPKFDGILKGMGLGVATGASRVASSCGMGLRNLGRAINDASRLRRNAGTALMGMAMNPAKNFSPEQREKIFNAGRQLIAPMMGIGQGRDSNTMAAMASNIGATGGKIGDDVISGQQAGDILNRAMKNPQNKDLSNAVGALSDNKLKEGMQAIVGNGAVINAVQRANYRGADGIIHEGVNVTGTYKDSNGQIKNFSGLVGASQYMTSSANIPNCETPGIGLQTVNSMQKGQTLEFSSSFDAATFAGNDVQTALDSVQGTMGDKLYEGGALEYVGKNTDGEDAFKVYDSDGTQLGSIAGDDFTPSISQMDVDERDNFLTGSVSDNCEQIFGSSEVALVDNNGVPTGNTSMIPNYEFDTGENGEIWRQSESDPSIYSASVRGYVDGEEVQYKVSMQDIGENPTVQFDSRHSYNSAYESEGVNATGQQATAKVFTSWKQQKEDFQGFHREDNK